MEAIQEHITSSLAWKSMEAIQEHIQQLESQAKSIRGKAALLTSKQDKRARQSLYKLADQTKRAAIRYEGASDS